MPTIDHSHYMQLALTQASKCTPTATAYCVGAVLVDSSVADASKQVVCTGYSRELPGNTHAEECCLLKLVSRQQSTTHTTHTDSRTSLDQLKLPPSYVMYTTMEPCSERLSGKTPCTDLLLSVNLQHCVVACAEPPKFVEHCVGVEKLKQHGVRVEVLEQYREEALRIAQRPAEPAIG